MSPKNLKGIVIHYTASADSIERTANYLAKENVNASAHLIIDRDGKVIQITPFHVNAWHAGKSEYLNLKNLNKYTIGIELMNWGRLKKEGSKYITWSGKIIPESEVQLATHKNEKKESYWHKYTEIQITRTKEICELLLQEYDGIEFIVGHETYRLGEKRSRGRCFRLKTYKT